MRNQVHPLNKFSSLFFFLSNALAVLCTATESGAQSSKNDSLNFLSVLGEAKNFPPLPRHTHIFSDFNLTFTASGGYLPSIENTLSNGFSKSYWLQASSKIFGLPFNLSMSTGSSIFVEPQSFDYHQVQFSFDCRKFLDDLKQEMIEKVSARLKEKEEKLATLHIADSISRYKQLKDTLANSSYQSYVSRLRDSRQAILDSIQKGLPCDTLPLSFLRGELNKYEVKIQSFSKLMHFQESVYDFQNTILKDSLNTLVNIEKIRMIDSKDALLQQASSLGINFGKRLIPLNFKEAAIGTQVLNHSELTFYNYYSSGLTVTYNDQKYIAKVAAVKNNLGFTNPLSIADTPLYTTNYSQRAILIGLGLGDLNHEYNMVSMSYVQNDGITELSPSLLLLSYLQQVEATERIHFLAEVGTTLNLSGNHIENSVDSAEAVIKKSSVLTSVNYECDKIKADFVFETSYIGEGYYTAGNLMLQPGTLNAAVGWKQELFHSSLLLNYKINYTGYIDMNQKGSSHWYQIAQVSYRFGKAGTFSFIITPYRFNYYVPQSVVLNSSKANFIDLNLTFNIPAGKQKIYTNWNFSNYAYQSTYADTAFSNSTKHISCYMMTSIGKRNVSLMGNYFLPVQSNDTSYFINNVEIAGTLLQTKMITLVIGPKWLGYQIYNDQLGAKAQLCMTLGKRFLVNAALEKYLDVEKDKVNYPSTIMASADLTFRL